MEGINRNGEISDDARRQVDSLLKAEFRPEFLNRIDEIVFYKPLTRTEIDSIVDLLLKDLEKRLAEKQLSVKLTRAAREHIADAGYDPQYGARPLKRYLQGKLETLIARSMIRDDPEPGTVYTVDYNGETLVISK
jgi:ATP-dependent Clp protease ATP-binding subunit ClpB